MEDGNILFTFKNVASVREWWFLLFYYGITLVTLVLSVINPVFRHAYSWAGILAAHNTVTCVHTLHELYVNEIYGHPVQPSTETPTSSKETDIWESDTTQFRTFAPLTRSGIVVHILVRLLILMGIPILLVLVPDALIPVACFVTILPLLQPMLRSSRYMFQGLYYHFAIPKYVLPMLDGVLYGLAIQCKTPYVVTVLWSIRASVVVLDMLFVFVDITNIHHLAPVDAIIANPTTLKLFMRDAEKRNIRESVNYVLDILAFMHSSPEDASKMAKQIMNLYILRRILNVSFSAFTGAGGTRKSISMDALSAYVDARVVTPPGTPPVERASSMSELTLVSRPVTLTSSLSDILLIITPFAIEILDQHDLRSTGIYVRSKFDLIGH